MAKVAWTLNIGDLVYRPFEILKPGKIFGIEFRGQERYLEVRWLDGSVSTEWDNQLNDFNHATDEHLKKYQKLDALRNKVLQIASK